MVHDCGGIEDVSSTDAGQRLATKVWQSSLDLVLLQSAACTSMMTLILCACAGYCCCCQLLLPVDVDGDSGVGVPRFGCPARLSVFITR
jgi:hypothetical protein